MKETLVLFAPQEQEKVNHILQYSQKEILAKGICIGETYTRDLMAHTERVAAIAVLLGILYQFNLDTLIHLGIGGYLHDIGKCDITSRILDKPKRLSSTEYQLVQSHPSIGYRNLQPYGFSEDIMDMVLYHHEKLDGSGYPTGKTSLPIEVQLLTIADMLDAILSKRVYHESRSPKEVFAILEQEKGLNQTAITILKSVWQTKSASY